MGKGGGKGMKKPLLNIMSFISRFNIPICLFGLYVFLTRAMEIQNCVIKWIIGYPCPGCGMTRAVFSLIQFDFIQAFRYNPFVYLLPFLFLGIAFQHIDFVKKIISNKWLAIGIASLILIAYILRFVYIYPAPPMDFYEHNLLSYILKLFSS